MVSVTSTRGYQAARRRQPRPVDPNTHRNIRMIPIIILALSLCLLAWCKFNDPHTLPIRNVKINGNYPHVNKEAIQQTVLPFLKKGFAHIDLEGLKKALQSLPWVDNVTVSRVWPDKLVINLVEHDPVAQWNLQGLLDSNGVIFTPQSFPPESLPSLNGPEGQQMFVWQSYQKLNAQLAPLGLKIAQLYLSARQAWNIQLSNGVKVILGRVNPELRLQRLIASYPQIVGSHSADIDYIDMRYTSGMAVKWKQSLMPNTAS